MLIPDCAANLFIDYSSVKFDISDSCNFPQPKLTYHKFFWRYAVMKSYLRKLKAYVNANPTRFDDDCPLPALDSLYWHYTECHTMTNEKTKQASRNLSAYLRFLPPKKRDAIYCLASTLCAEHESIAFIAGLQLGAQLMLELTEEAGK